MLFPDDSSSRVIKTEPKEAPLDGEQVVTPKKEDVVLAPPAQTDTVSPIAHSEVKAESSENENDDNDNDDDDETSLSEIKSRHQREVSNEDGDGEKKSGCRSKDEKDFEADRREETGTDAEAPEGDKEDLPLKEPKPKGRPRKDRVGEKAEVKVEARDLETPSRKKVTRVRSRGESMDREGEGGINLLLSFCKRE